MSETSEQQEKELRPEGISPLPILDPIYEKWKAANFGPLLSNIIQQLAD
jgi:hypothetical protein